MNELQKAQAEEIRANMKLKAYGFYQRWLIAWLVLGGVLKPEALKGVLAWMSG